LIVSVIEIILVTVFGFFLLYLALLSVLALTARKRSAVRSSKFQRIAVVVPAHNEESSIEQTVRSLLAVDYPREFFDVIVVADNSSDRTAEVARNAGATVHVRQNPELRGKGYAVNWCFAGVLSEHPGYDALAVVDADSVVSSNFLSVMNHYLERGARAIQCSDMVEPSTTAWSSEVTRIGFTLYNYARPLGRRVIGCSAGLRGNGMCFTASTLRSVPWEAYSQAEDLEYGLELLLRGVTVVFAPEATVLSPMPQNVGNAESQRARWEAGRLPLIRRYAGRLLIAAFNQLSFRQLDGFVDLVTPPLVNLLVSVLLFLCLSLLLWMAGIAEAGQYVIAWLALIALAGIHVMVGLRAAGANIHLYKSLVYIPRYALWKIGLYAKLLRRGHTKTWVRTTRDRSVAHSTLGEANRKMSE
jgi:1,2-diacylglycerol 3-beta-glucosyltransferase